MNDQPPNGDSQRHKPKHVHSEKEPPIRIGDLQRVLVVVDAQVVVLTLRPQERPVQRQNCRQPKEQRPTRRQAPRLAFAHPRTIGAAHPTRPGRVPRSHLAPTLTTIDAESKRLSLAVFSTPITVSVPLPVVTGGHPDSAQSMRRRRCASLRPGSRKSAHTTRRQRVRGESGHIDLRPGVVTWS